MIKREPLIQNIPWISLATCYMALGVLFYAYGIPLRSLVWDEELLAPLFNFFNFDWTTYAKSTRGDQLTRIVSGAFGIFFVGTSLFTIYKREKLNFKSKLLKFSPIALILWAILKWKAHNSAFPILIEYSLLFGLPFCFINLKYGYFFTALTFIGHGLFACNIYQTPSHFFDMTLTLTPFGFKGATYFLLTVGILDIVLATLLFCDRFKRYALIYCIAWGLLTALARPLFFLELEHSFFLKGVTGFFQRTPHFLVPLWLYLKEFSSDKN